MPTVMKALGVVLAAVILFHWLTAGQSRIINGPDEPADFPIMPASPSPGPSPAP